MKSKALLHSQKGFTLIEIISVLVLLGILAAVAVPKFFDLQTEAKKKAAEGAVAEGVSQVNLASARYILLNGTTPANLAALTGMASGALVNPYEEGDFSITFADAAGVSILVTATGKTGTSVALATANKTVKLPQP